MSKKDVEEIYDKYASGYQSGDFAPETFDTGRVAMGFADDITWHFLTKFLPEEKSIEILDAGAGDGYWAQKLVKLGYSNIVLADLSQGMLDQARKRFAKLRVKHNVKFVKSDIRNMVEFQSNTFDYVFSQYDAVSYCLKPREAVLELARVAKKDAHVIVCLDTKFKRVSELIEARQIHRAEELLRTNISYDFTHPQYNLTWQELAEYYENAGLTIVEVVGAPVFMHQVNKNVLKGLEENIEVRTRLLEMELKHCTNRSLVNFAGHLQMIGRKT
ncbi:MAG: class I SAM-dependent methyltransferase [Candidatus Bathyarchaeota archaeon]|nr:MAG: class I SAM-dependent methyltransferase [Candidatus Bathyarchaeota archaeon]